MGNMRFVSLIAYLSGGLIVWAAAFTVAYTVAAVVCARRLADTTVLGFPILPFSIGATNLVALLATGAIVLVAYRRRPDMAGESDWRSFVEAMALIVALLAAVGIVWNAIPALVFDTCQ